MDVEGKVFIVTGGGSGLGAATARMFVESGGSVVIADVQEEPGNRVASELGDRARFVRTDVTSEQEVQAAVDTALGTFGGLNGAVNCAGIPVVDLVVRRDRVHSLKDFARVINVNLVGTFNMIRLAASGMRDLEPTASGERGVFVNTASVAAFEGQIGQAAYSASKGGIVAMTLPIARELARFGIRVLTIAPGTFDTPMMQEGTTDDAKASLAAQIPWPKRLGRPDEYAALVKHIVENEMLNGEVIRLDGAIRMAIS